MNPTTRDVGYLRDVLGEIASEKIVLICGKHNYVAARKRANGVVAVPPETHGCPECWNCYYTTDLALTPPGKRQERLDELEQVVRHLVEYEQKGKFSDDLELFEPTDPRFQVKYEQDAADDETGADKIVNPSEEELR